MKKIIINYICIILIIFIGAGCTQDTNDLTEEGTDKFVINENVYSEEDESNNKYIEIKYPSLFGSIDEETEKLINDELENKAMEILDDFTSLEGMDIRTSYSVTLTSPKILSVIYIANTMHTQQAYPLVRTDTVNIELATGTVLSVDDIVIIDDDFITVFREKFENISEYDSVEDREIVNQYVSEMVSYDMFTEGAEGSFPEVSYFLTSDSLVISIAVPYSLGSYALYSANYSDISEHILIEQ